jgi:LmbE family N-acetylglucosaminyl deacetylase
VSDIWFLGRADGRLEREDSSTLIDDISGHIRRVRPQVVITTAPGGFDPHPDHVAVSQLALASIVRAARACPAGSHMVDKLYYIAWTQTMWEAYESAFRPLRLVVDGSVRTATPCPEWAVTARLDTSSVWKTVWKAVQCHRTQIADCAALLFTDEGHRALWGVQRFSRAFSLIPGGRPLETDLFEGLRSPRTGKAGGRGGSWRPRRGKRHGRSR